MKLKKKEKMQSAGRQQMVNQTFINAFNQYAYAYKT